jgi:hypothetical protein
VLGAGVDQASAEGTHTAGREGYQVSALGPWDFAIDNQITKPYSGCV